MGRRARSKAGILSLTAHAATAQLPAIATIGKRGKPAPRLSAAPLSSQPALSTSVTRWGYFPPKWLFLASPGGENFGGAETAKSLNGGYFWTFLIFINKITK